MARKRTLRALACSLCVWLFTPGLSCGAAQPAPGASTMPHRPRIGLVLAGGGAKGGAHVGVIKVLEQMHVPIDCIAGTSMGALVGGGYAAGLPAAELEKFVTNIDWKAVVGGAEGRRLQPIEQKRLAMAASTNFELGLRDGAVIAPAGLAKTSGIDDLLRTYVARARSVADFNQLPIPYRAVATDMVTGTMVVLDRGDLATAMRASMAIPGAFSPVLLDKYILSDGGQVRNLPIDVARDMCADVVIAVNLVAQEVPPEKLLQSSQLIARSMDVMLQANVNLQLATLTDKDIRIDVPMGDIGTADFERVNETIPLGEAAAHKAANRLAEFALPEAEYVAWRQGVTTRQHVETKLADVKYEGLKHVNPDYLRSLTSIRPGDTVNIAAISADALKISALRDIDTVAYRIDGDPANATLTWMPEEASVGVGVVSPSLGLYSSGGGDTKFLLGGQFVRHWMNDLGGQWRINVQVGYESLLTTSFYQPFDVAQRFFVEPRVFASRSVEDLFVDGESVAVYRFIDLGGGLDFGANLGRAAQLRLGYLNSKRRAESQTGISNLPGIDQRIPETDVRDAGLAATFIYDSRDADTYSRQGMAAKLQYVQSDESLGADRNWGRLEGGLRTAVPVGRNAMWLSLAGGSDVGSDTLPGDRAFSLGGPKSLPAYQLDEFRARGYWLAEASFLWRLVDLVSVKSQAIFGGFGLQAAGLYDRVDRVHDGEVYSASAYVGGPTPIGTFTLGIGGATDSWGFWLALGRPVGKGAILDEALFR